MGTFFLYILPKYVCRFYDIGASLWFLVYVEALHACLIEKVWEEYRMSHSIKDKIN